MDAVLDVIPSGQSVLPIMANDSAPVDLLNRQGIIDKIMKILTVIHENRSSCTFALNGSWGTGKTFVLNMLMNQLWEYHSDDYIVFHYNCWQYDYYEEPLIAIVAAMLDSVDEENHLLPTNLCVGAKVGLDKVKEALNKIATGFVKNKIGVDLTDVVSFAKEYQSAVDAEHEKRAASRSFDEFYSFKKAIHRAQKEIEEISAKRTLVVIVDELDRCLPAYAIKVLERLHHLFSGLSNTAVFLAVDKSQLDMTITQIFGEHTKTSKYLSKFVNYELQLDNPEMTKGFFEKYADYVALFDNTLIQTTFPYEEFITLLFSGIDMRTQERLMDRAKTVHKIVFPSKKKDYSFMCCELMYLISTDIYKLNEKSPLFRNIMYPYEKTLKNGTLLTKSPQKAIYTFGINSVFPNANKINSLLSVDMTGYWGQNEAKDIRPFCSYFTKGNQYILKGHCVIQELLFFYARKLYNEPEELHTFVFSINPLDVPLVSEDILSEDNSYVTQFREINRVFFEKYTENTDGLMIVKELLKIIK